MSAQPSALPVRAHEMGIYKRYFDLIATGPPRFGSTTPAAREQGRLADPVPLRGRSDPHAVTRVARYISFEEMFDHEAITSVNPLATREDQLANIRQIYPPEREALGIVAIGIELVDRLA